MTAFKPGEIVDVEIKGALVVGSGEATRGPYVKLALTVGGAEIVGKVHLNADGVTVTRVAPAEWPPKPGDLWQDADHTRWFAIDTSKSIRLTCGGELMWPDRVLELFGALTLINRADGGQPT